MAQYSQKGIIFLLLLAIVVIVLISMAYFWETISIAGENFLYVLVLIGFMVFIYKMDILKLKDYERAVIFRFGKLNRVGGPGWALVLPFIEAYTHVDLRTKTLDVERQDTVTKDSIEIKIDAVLYLKVRKDSQSVINSVLEVEDFQAAARSYVVSSIRDVIGSMHLAEVISNIEKINTHVQEDLGRIADEWGVRVIAVQIKDLQIPEAVLSAMHEQKAAVQQKLARIERAIGHKAEIDAVKEAAAGLSDRALNYYYIKALEEMSKGKSTKLIFPLQFSNLAQSIGNRIGGSQSDAKIEEAVRKALEKNVETAVKKAKKEEKAKKK